jgi:hypothetical protein
MAIAGLTVGATALLAGALGAFGGLIGAAAQHREEVERAETALERAREVGRVESEAAEAANRLAAGQAVDVFEARTGAAAETEAFAVEQALGREAFALETAAGTEALAQQRATAAFDIGISENVATQAETRRQTNIGALDVRQQGLLGGGATTARLAGSGVRGTGSAASLVSESNRLFDIGVQQIDERLAIEEAGFARGRGDLATVQAQSLEEAGFARERAGAAAGLTREQAVGAAGLTRTQAEEAAGLGLEQTLEGITGADIDVAPGANLDDLLAGLDFEDALLTERQETQFSFLIEDIEDIKAGGGVDLLTGAVQGAFTLGIPFL